MTVVVIMALLFWGGVFLIFFTAHGTTPGEFFFGRYEDPPSDLGKWKESGIDEASHWVREERFLLPRNDPGAGHLLHQVRYRDPETHTVVRVEPERRVRRRRVNTRQSG